MPADSLVCADAKPAGVFRGLPVARRRILKDHHTRHSRPVLLRRIGQLDLLPRPVCLAAMRMIAKEITAVFDVKFHQFKLQLTRFAAASHGVEVGLRAPQSSTNNLPETT